MQPVILIVTTPILPPPTPPVYKLSESLELLRRPSIVDQHSRQGIWLDQHSRQGIIFNDS